MYDHVDAEGSGVVASPDASTLVFSSKLALGRGFVSTVVSPFTVGGACVRVGATAGTGAEVEDGRETGGRLS